MHIWHIDILNPWFYSDIRFYTAISYVQRPLRDPRHFHDCWRRKCAREGNKELRRALPFYEETSFARLRCLERQEKGKMSGFLKLPFERQKFHSQFNFATKWKTWFLQLREILFKLLFFERDEFIKSVYVEYLILHTCKII